MKRRAPGCGAVRGDLGFMLVPEHDPERASVLRDHLAGCAACREVFAEVRRNYTALRQAPAPEPGPRFSREIMDRLPRRVPRRRKIVRLALLPLVAMVGLVPGLGSVAAFGLPGFSGPGVVGIGSWASDAVSAVVRFVGGALASAVSGEPGARLGAPGLGLGAGLAHAGLMILLAGVLVAGLVGTLLALRRRAARLSG